MKNLDNLNKIWITWENQRRSNELAKTFGAKLYILSNKSIPVDCRFIRYIYLGLKTLIIIIKEKPKLLFVQNPSIVLSVLSCTLKFFFNYILVIDRHSNFKLETIGSLRIKYRLFHYISKYTVKNADLTIVTNTFLASLVKSWNGKSYILQDKLPDLNRGNIVKLKGEKNIVFISSFSNDEPIREVITAAGLINERWVIYITGNYKKFNEKNLIQKKLPPNVIFTGFLSEKDYQSLLASVDIVMALTTQSHTLTCGAYEGVSMSKPLILSNTYALKKYFVKGAIFTNATQQNIAYAINQAIEKNEYLKKKIEELKVKLMVDWEKRFVKLSKVISTLI